VTIAGKTVLTLEPNGELSLSVNANGTLTGLSNGAHSLIVYAKDTAGNIGSSETIYFSIEPPQPSQQPTGFLGSSLRMEYGFATVAIITVAIAAAAIYLLLKRRKSATQTETSIATLKSEI
jgi:hypothetical protein